MSRARVENVPSLDFFFLFLDASSESLAVPAIYKDSSTRSRTKDYAPRRSWHPAVIASEKGVPMPSSLTIFLLKNELNTLRIKIIHKIYI